MSDKAVWALFLLVSVAGLCVLVWVKHQLPPAQAIDEVDEMTTYGVQKETLRTLKRLEQTLNHIDHACSSDAGTTGG